MTVGRLISILTGVDPTLPIQFEDDFGDGLQITHVKMIDGKIMVGDGYSSEKNFWHPGNGNKGRGVKLLGNTWGEQTK